MDEKAVAGETLRIIASGEYVAPSGATVDVEPLISHAVTNSRTYTPHAAEQAVLGLPALEGPPRITVTAESTAAAARRLYVEGHRDVGALNFASARNEGGGFLNGARAQEEDLARCSALYACLTPQQTYYEANRQLGSMLYTDHAIYSPDVPFFRDDRLQLLEEPYLCSIVTSPAPNAGQALSRDPHCRPAIEETLRRRARQVLALFAVNERKTLVLGAWGCGVFRNDPTQVAGVFKALLAEPIFRGAFTQVVFGILDRTRERTTLRAFEDAFS